MKVSDIYCEKILTGELPVEILHETSNVLAFKHTNPYWETHVVIIPKRHVESLTRLAATDSAALSELMTVATEVCAEIEKRHGGCRLSTNVGSYQTSKHLHFYVQAGRRLRDEAGNIIGGDHHS